MKLNITIFCLFFLILITYVSSETLYTNFVRRNRNRKNKLKKRTTCKALNAACSYQIVGSECCSGMACSNGKCRGKFNYSPCTEDSCICLLACREEGRNKKCLPAMSLTQFASLNDQQMKPFTQCLSSENSVAAQPEPLKREVWASCILKTNEKCPTAKQLKYLVNLKYCLTTEARSFVPNEDLLGSLLQPLPMKTNGSPDWSQCKDFIPIGDYKC